MVLRNLLFDFRIQLLQFLAFDGFKSGPGLLELRNEFRVFLALLLQPHTDFPQVRLHPLIVSDRQLLELIVCRVFKMQIPLLFVFQEGFDGLEGRVVFRAAFLQLIGLFLVAQQPSEVLLYASDLAANFVPVVLRSAEQHVDLVQLVDLDLEVLKLLERRVQFRFVFVQN